MVRIEDKINEIYEYLEKMELITPKSFEEYVNNYVVKAACERYAEIIIEAIIDLVYLIIKEKKLPIPKNDLNAFDILLKNKIISKNLAERLQDAKRMRNILAHEYGKIDDEIVFEAITKELNKDASEFIKEIKKWE